MHMQLVMERLLRRVNRTVIGMSRQSPHIVSIAEGTLCPHCFSVSRVPLGRLLGPVSSDQIHMGPSHPSPCLHAVQHGSLRNEWGPGPYSLPRWVSWLELREDFNCETDVLPREGDPTGWEGGFWGA